MKIATWNVNSLNARMERVLEFLELHRPDLLLMQETKVDPDKFPDLAFAEAGYHAVHHSAGRWAGVAIAAPRESRVRGRQRRDSTASPTSTRRAGSKPPWTACA